MTEWRVHQDLLTFRNAKLTPGHLNSFRHQQGGDVGARPNEIVSQRGMLPYLLYSAESSGSKYNLKHSILNVFHYRSQ